MKMSRLEKRLVNRSKKGLANAKRVQACLETNGVDAPGDILELGCGAGYVSAVLAERYSATVRGVDVDPDQINKAQATHGESKRLQFRVGDAMELEFADASFDLVVAQNVFHHLSDWHQGLKESARVLRKGGHLIWYDLIFPRAAVALLRRVAPRMGYFSIASIQSAFRKHYLETVSHRATFRGLFTHHEFVVKKC